MIFVVIKRPERNSILYYESIRGHGMIPFSPWNEISEAEAEKLLAYFKGYYDAERRLFKFEQYLRTEKHTFQKIFEDEYFYNDKGKIYKVLSKGEGLAAFYISASDSNPDGVVFILDAKGRIVSATKTNGEKLSL